MTTVIAFVKALPEPLAVGWILLAGWAAVQIVWFRWARIEAPAVLPAAERRMPPRRRIAKSIETTAASSGSVLGLN